MVTLPRYSNALSTTPASDRPGRIPGTQPSRVAPAGMWPRSAAPGAGGGDRVAEAPPRPEGVVHRGRLVPAVHHAVAALLVAAALTVILPARGLEQLLERRRVALLEQIAGALPAEDVEGRVAPRRALEILLAHEEL